MTILGDDIWGDDWTIGFEDNVPNEPLLSPLKVVVPFLYPIRLERQSYDRPLGPHLQPMIS